MAAEDNAPPADYRPMLPLLAFGAFALFWAFAAPSFWGLLQGMLLAGIAALAAMVALMFVPSDAAKEARARYDRQWSCLKCGQVFEHEPAPQAAATPPWGTASDQPHHKAESELNDTIRRARDHVSRFYDGPSLAVRAGAPVTRETYASRILHPVQRTKNATQRDESGLIYLMSIAAESDASFDPVAANIDVGIISRLASLGYVAFDAAAGKFTLTETGIAKAREALSRA